MHPPARARTWLIKSESQWDAITSPTRLELIFALHTGGPLSIAQLADRTDRPADALYHHVRKLIAGGLFVEVGTRRVGRQTETVYDFVADRLLFDFDAMTGRNADRWKAVGSMVLRMTERSFLAAIDQAGLLIAGPHKDLWSRMDTARLTPADLARVNRHLLAVDRIMALARARARQPAGARLFYLTLFMMPAVRARGSRRPGVGPARANPPARRSLKSRPSRQHPAKGVMT